MKLEIENDILKSLEEPLRTTNKVYISNWAENLVNGQMLRENKIIVKPKPILSAPKPQKAEPKDIYEFDYLDLKHVIKDGVKSKEAMNKGRVVLGRDGIKFINPDRPSHRIEIHDYDFLHVANCQKSGVNYEVNLYGRKMKKIGKDSKNCQDPMEQM
jgi:hypothetical protein